MATSSMIPRGWVSIQTSEIELGGLTGAEPPCGFISSPGPGQFSPRRLFCGDGGIHCWSSSSIVLKAFQRSRNVLNDYATAVLNRLNQPSVLQAADLQSRHGDVNRLILIRLCRQGLEARNLQGPVQKKGLAPRFWQNARSNALRPAGRLRSNKLARSLWATCATRTEPSPQFLALRR